MFGYYTILLLLSQHAFFSDPEVVALDNWCPWVLLLLFISTSLTGRIMV